MSDAFEANPHCTPELEASLQALLDAPVYDLPQAQKADLLLRRLNALNQWHQQHSPEFARILAGYGWPVVASDATALPFLAVRLFKHLLLASVPEAERFKTLTSSGTTGAVSRIVLDKTIDTPNRMKLHATILWMCIAIGTAGLSGVRNRPRSGRSTKVSATTIVPVSKTLIPAPDQAMRSTRSHLFAPIFCAAMALTAALQSKVLVRILQEFLGKQRLPMLLIEQPALIQNRSGFSARGAGALGLSFLGRDHHYALDEQMQPNWPVIEAFCASEHSLMFFFHDNRLHTAIKIP